MTNSKKGLLATLRRELAYIARRPIYLFASIGAPLLVASLLLYHAHLFVALMPFKAQR